MRRWFIFGESPDGTTVDVADGERDVLTSVPRRMAEGIIAARDAFLDTVMDHLCGAAAAGKSGDETMKRKYWMLVERDGLPAEPVTLLTTKTGARRGAVFGRRAVQVTLTWHAAKKTKKAR